jgi:hypothetical protein
MAKANWDSASALQNNIPHTYTAFEHLIMAMADAQNNKGKATFFGNDKGLKSYIKFESKLKDALIALTLDGIVARTSSSEEYREALLAVMATWFEIFPNWNDAQLFAYGKFMSNPVEARNLIASLVGLRQHEEPFKPKIPTQERKVVMPQSLPKALLKGEARCPKCQHEDSVMGFDLSDIGDLYRRCPKCGMNFQA